MANDKLMTLTADIVAAHVAHNSVSLGDVPTLSAQVHSALATLGEPGAEAEQEAKTPVISVRASIKPDYIVCMECGTKQKMLKRHIKTAHSMTPDQYRADYGLPKDYPMVAPANSQQRRTLAHSIGLGRKKGIPSDDVGSSKAAVNVAHDGQPADPSRDTGS